MNAMTIADDSVKYRVERGNDVYHILFTDEFRKDPKTNNVYGFPREIFQQSAPPGDEISVEFTVAGIDRTNILKEDDPDYDKLITRWKSITGNRSAGLGSNRVNSPSHAVGLATEHHLLTNGIVRYDESGRLEVVIRKKDTVPLSKEEKEEMRKKGFKTNGRIEQNIANKSIASFKCKVCGSEEYYFEGGCHSPKCKECSWTQGDCG